MPRRKRSFAGFGSSVVDTAAEAAVGISRRPMRAMLTALGTVLGVGAFVATAGLTSTASAQISSRFDVLKATAVVLQENDGAARSAAFPPDFAERLESLNGVRSAGLAWSISADVQRGSAAYDPDARVFDLPVTAMTPGYLDAIHASMSTGTGLDPLHEARSEPVAVVGRAAAAQLGISNLENGPAIFLDDVPVTVIGIVDDVDRDSGVLLSVLIPASTGRALWGAAESPPRVLIDVQLGAAQLIGRQAPLALHPEDPGRLRAIVPPDPTRLREGVEGDVNDLFIVLAGISVLIGALGIANTTLVSVLERVGEIGLRRAVGASRARIAGQFLTETSILGAVGGLVGTSLGVIAIVGAAAAREWTPVIAPAYVLPAPLIGLVTGFAAGLYPAAKAAAITPIEALRR